MTATLEAPPKGIDKLRALAKPKPAAKQETPQVAIPELTPILRKLEEAKIQQKDIEATVKGLQVDAVALVTPHHVRLSRERGACLSSLKIAGMTFIQQCRYSAIKDLSDDGGPTLDAQEDELRRLDPEFDVHFQEVMEITVDVKKLSDAQMELLASLDPQVTRTLKPTAAFHQDRVLKPAVAAIAEQARLTPTQYFKVG